jgi:hypothetical protein
MKKLLLLVLLFPVLVKAAGLTFVNNTNQELSVQVGDMGTYSVIPGIPLKLEDGQENDIGADGKIYVTRREYSKVNKFVIGNPLGNPTIK